MTYHNGTVKLGLTVFRILLSQSEDQLYPSERIAVWFESFDNVSIQVGSDSQNIELVNTPDINKEIGDLDFAYYLIGELHGNIEAEFIEPETNKKYKIGEMDFSDYVGYGSSFIHIDRYFKPTQ